MTRLHYVRPFSSLGPSRVSVCGEVCEAGGGHDGKAPMGTTRLLSVRCRACVMVLRVERDRREFAILDDDGEDSAEHVFAKSHEDAVEPMLFALRPGSARTVTLVAIDECSEVSEDTGEIDGPRVTFRLSCSREMNHHYSGYDYDRECERVSP